MDKSQDTKPGRSLSVRDLSKIYGQTKVVSALSFSVRPHEFVCLLGPSGCGKTTTLRIIAGFIEADTGSVFVQDEDVTRKPPNKRDMGMVYQSYALFPHMTVFDNVAFGLRMRHVARAEAEERVRKVLASVRLTELADRKPTQLSGGQQQRVALARAMVLKPALLLLDEPLSNLDARLRKDMQSELKQLQRGSGITTLHVTHDQEEALTLADTVIILNKGRLEQIGKPKEIYGNPQTRFVAEFMGKANFLRGTVSDFDGSQNSVFRSQGGDAFAVVDRKLPKGAVVDAFIRPEKIDLSKEAHASSRNQVRGTIDDVSFLGSTSNVSVRLADGVILTVDQINRRNDEWQPGDTVYVSLPAEEMRLLPVQAPELIQE